MSDIEEVAAAYLARTGRRLRVATKYLVQTRAFFARHGIADYRIVESGGATEGAPAAGAAELVVDITTTGATLAANNLKVLSDGVILKSEAQFAAALKAPCPATISTWSASSCAPSKPAPGPSSWPPWPGRKVRTPGPGTRWPNSRGKFQAKDSGAGGEGLLTPMKTLFDAANALAERGNRSGVGVASGLCVRAGVCRRRHACRAAGLFRPLRNPVF